MSEKKENPASEVNPEEIENLENDEILVEEKDSEEKQVTNKEYEELEEKYSKLEGTYQRLLADYENSKRRNAIEVIDASTKGKVEVFEKIVDIVDNFDRSMQFDIQTEEFKNGITMLHGMFGERLANVGLEEVRHEGTLDPNIHQAISVEEVEDGEDDQILEVLQKGYCVGDKIIRPAMVKVSKKK